MANVKKIKAAVGEGNLSAFSFELTNDLADLLTRDYFIIFGHIFLTDIIYKYSCYNTDVRTQLFPELNNFGAK